MGFMEEENITSKFSYNLSIAECITMLYLQIINVHRRTPILMREHWGCRRFEPVRGNTQNAVSLFGIRGKPNYATTTLRHPLKIGKRGEAYRGER
jgi:hypothetical protein